MDRNEFGNLFNHIAELLERLHVGLPAGSAERQQVANTINSLVMVARLKGIEPITVEEFEQQRARKTKKPPKLTLVK